MDFVPARNPLSAISKSLVTYFFEKGTIPRLSRFISVENKETWEEHHFPTLPTATNPEVVLRALKEHFAGQLPFPRPTLPPPPPPPPTPEELVERILKRRMEKK